MLEASWVRRGTEEVASMRIVGIVAIIILAGLGLYYAVLVPVLAGHLVSLPWGLLLLLAAAVVVIYMVRYRPSNTTPSPSRPKESEDDNSV